MQEGMILHRYYLAIERLPLFVFKPLGGCSYCFGTWIFLSVYMLSIAEISTQILLGIGINHIFIRIIEKI
jgi:hypothetical protein